ncbi:SusC/RagA family TonB-linked outer membrane protein [Pedobacter sp. P351]|uniref:SusC/RagA family TonB-linked outer membrane protein n=1 Tax=Pedobacter superstes TaxID=3133441 RepID=UPI0030B70DD3
MKNTYIYISCFFITVSLLFSDTLFAQSTAKITVRGKVIDSKDKLGVIGASVVELDKDKRTIRGVVTDIDGNYALPVSNPANSIQVSYLGYRSIVQAINGRTTINFQMVSSSSVLEDVVIQGQRTISNGSGLNVEARNSTVATSTVNADDLKELSAASIDQALQGRMPGVDFGATSGDPGAGMSIRIRGTSSINGSAEPLIVLDGMPYETQIPDDFNFGSADEQGYAQLLNISPSDIKDITVLKDAAATAIWGSRAQNGVLVINTKRGLVSKPSLSYNVTGTFSKQPENIPLLSGDQYSNLIPEAVNNMNRLPLNISANQEFLYDPLMPFSFYNYGNNSDWVGSITRQGFQHNHNLSMSGGGEKARYYASVGYLNNKGTTMGTDVNRITAKVNLDYSVSNRIRFQSDFTYTHIDNTALYTSGVRNIAYAKMPNMAIYQYDEFGNETPNYFSPAFNIQGQYGSTYNPLAMAQEASSRLLGERIIPHFNLRYDILPELLISTFDLQFDINNTKSKTFLPQVATGRPATETVVNRASDNDGDAFGVGTKLNFIFTPKLGENTTLTSLLSFQTDDSQGFGQNITTSNTASSFLQDPSNPARTQNGDLNLSASLFRTRSVGVATSHKISLFDRYLIDVGARLDGSSRFGNNNKYGVFPFISTRWRVSGEPFMKNTSSWLDDLSIRASFGQSGGRPGRDYSFYNTYNPTSLSYMGMSGVVPGNIGLDNLKWQTTNGLNLGFNLWTFKSRFKVDLDFYHNKITDLFFDNLRIPNYTGYNSLSVNVGTMTNKGFEVSLNTIPYRSKNLVLGFDFNIAQNLNIINKVSEYYPRNDGRVIGNGVYRSYLQPGNPFGSFYGFKYKGVYTDQDATIALDANGNQIIGPNGQIINMRYNFPVVDYTFQPGDAMYEDINKDGNINEDDIVYLGNGNAKVTGGFGPRITFKGNIMLQAFFSYKLGYELINTTLMNTTNMYNYNNQSTIVLKRWRNPGDVTDVPRALYASGYNWLGSDRYVSDASFVRLRSLTGRYTLNKGLASKLKVKSGYLFITGENLFTLTKYKGVDPDVSSRGPNNPFSFVVDDAMTPPTRNLVLGLTVGF